MYTCNEDMTDQVGERRQRRRKDVEYFIKLLNIFKAAVANSGAQPNCVTRIFICNCILSSTVNNLFICINIIFFQGSHGGRCVPVGFSLFVHRLSLME